MEEKAAEKDPWLAYLDQLLKAVDELPFVSGKATTKMVVRHDHGHFQTVRIPDASPEKN